MNLWDATTGALLRTFPVGYPGIGIFHSVVFSPDGARVLWASDGGKNNTASLWDTTTGGMLRTFSDISWVRFSADGAFMLSGSQDQKMKLWDATTGALLR